MHKKKYIIISGIYFVCSKYIKSMNGLKLTWSMMEKPNKAKGNSHIINWSALL